MQGRTCSTRRPATLLVAGLLAGPILAGCSPDQAPDPTPSPSVTEREPTPLPSMDGKTRGVVKDVELALCELEAGGVKAKGTVTNSTKKPADFAITIAWLPNNSADPVGVASTTVAGLAAGQSTEWSITTTLVDKADRCAVNARRGTLA